MKIGLVGGAGTLGGDLCLGLEAEVHVFDDFSTSAYSHEEISSMVGSAVVASVEDAVALQKWVTAGNFDVLIYLPTKVSSSYLESVTGNIVGIASLLDALKSSERRPHLIHIQSVLTRRCSGPIDENSPIEIRDAYSLGKYAVEVYLGQYPGTWTNLITSSVLSPRLSVGAIPAFVRRLSNKEGVRITDTKRDYLAPQDFVDAVTRVVMLDQSASGSFALGSGRALSTEKIFEAVKNAMGVSCTFEVVPPALGDPSEVIVDSGHFRSMTGWQPVVPVELALDSCIASVMKRMPLDRQHH